ncbi:MAG TPA: hypothetical protein VJN93_01725 [Candidatus Acidoferrum sp.]|nr:hypothetical protein [Candidatus Acidoferrum sp.]
MDKPKKIARVNYSMESTSFLGGLYCELHEQVHKYQALTRELLSLEARIELAEKQLCLARDHFAMTIDKTESALPNDWQKIFQSVRFVGLRLADACQALLQEKKKLTPQQFLRGLNEGMFRFRTNSPLREIHAALLKQTWANKVGDSYVWMGNPEQQMPLRMRVLNTQVIDQKPIKDGTTGSGQGKEE